MTTSRDQLDDSNLIEAHPLNWPVLIIVVVLSIAAGVGAFLMGFHWEDGIPFVSFDTYLLFRGLSLLFVVLFCALVFSSLLTTLAAIIKRGFRWKSLSNPPPASYRQSERPLILGLTSLPLILMLIKVNIGLMIGGCIAVLFGLFNLVILVLRWGQSIRIYEQHVVIPDRRGHENVIPLDEIEFIWERGTNGHIQLYDGTYYAITFVWKQVKQILMRLVQLTHDRLMKELARRFEAGEVIESGTMIISQEGMGTKDKLIPWSSIEQIAIIDGRFFAQREGTSLRIPGGHISTVPNIGLLSQLIWAVNHPDEQNILSRPLKVSTPPAEDTIAGPEPDRQETVYFRGGLRALYIAGIVVFLGGAFLVGLTFVQEWAWDPEMRSFILFTIGFLAVFYFYGFHILWLQVDGLLTKKIAISGSGLAYQRRGKPEVVITWDEVEAVSSRYFYIFWVPFVYHYRITTRDDRTIYLRQNIHDLEYLSQLLTDRLDGYRLPIFEEKLQKGEALTFGSITITGDGLQRPGAEPITWEEIDYVRVTGRRILIMRPGQRLWGRLPTHGTDNITLFVRLLAPRCKVQYTVSSVRV